MKGNGHLLICLPVLLLFLKGGEGAGIIGGKEVRPHSLPYMALLQDTRGNAVCGGTLINLRWVLTAAHCGSVKKVLLGVHSQSKPEQENLQIRKVKLSVPHPCYDSDSKVHDIMLLKLDKAAKKTKPVQPLPLSPPVQNVSAGTGCIVAGWGVTKNGGKTMSDVLLSANVTVIDRALCNSKDYYNLNPVITNDMLCVGSKDMDRADTCTGDSGGPLLCEGVLRGVTSFGTQCGLKKKPGVYAALTKKQTEWISKTIHKTIQSPL